jgi:hypothetical protein
MCMDNWIALVAAGVPSAVEPGVSPGGTRANHPDGESKHDARPGGRMPPSTAGGTPAATVHA